jgi:glycosyltransferase involved in cell wall biosynthesis
MKICVDARMVHSSGIGTVILNFLQNFNDTFKLTLVGAEQELLPLLKGKSNFSIINTSVNIYSVREQIALPWMIPYCDIFWSPHYNIPLLPIRAKKRVVTIHDVYHLAFRHTLSKAQQFYSTTLINRATANSNRTITVSNFSKSEIIKYTGVKPSSIDVFYNGVDTELFRPITNDELLLQTKQKYQLPDRYILCVGNVKPHKNLKRIIEAIKILGTSISDYKLVVVGKKEGFRTNDPHLANMINEDIFLKDHVLFTGYVPNEDLVNLYNLASLFVFPSLYEGFGLPPLEAMACGCPALVSNVASIPEICGDSVKYFNPNDASDLAQQIGLSLSEKKFSSDLVKKGINHAASFSWNENYKQHINLFESLLSD